jgi:hypothetical protein
LLIDREAHFEDTAIDDVFRAQLDESAIRRSSNFEDHATPPASRPPVRFVVCTINLDQCINGRRLGKINISVESAKGDYSE